jgi:hypothetical protein
MRLILLPVLLAACDQGAKPAAAATPEPPIAVVAKPTVPIAPPPYLVKDTDDFVRKTTVALNEVIGIFAQGGTDCDVVAAGLTRWGGENRTRFDILTRYAEAHPDAEKALTEHMKDRMNELTKTLVPTMTACGSHKGLQAALAELSNMQRAQRPR